MAGRKSYGDYWGVLPFFREDGTRYRHRINYERIPIPDSQDVECDFTYHRCGMSGSDRLEARKRMWRRIRTGYYDNGKHEKQLRPSDRGYGTAKRPKCGARCHDGHLCRNPVVNSPLTDKPSRRCKFHGGMSTGPRTEEGKAASLAALARGREARKGGRFS